jgi:CheY-like chemotaxis protein
MSIADPHQNPGSLLPLDDFYSSKLQRLMSYRVRKVLLVASLYDSFILEEEGRLADLLGQIYKQRDLGYVPTLTRVTGGQAALKALDGGNFDMVVSLQRLGDMDPFSFGRAVKDKQPGLPVVVLAYSTPELQRLVENDDGRSVDKIFAWQGDGKIMAGIIQYIEDVKNCDHDTALVGVPNLLMLEDSVHFYSSYIYQIYEELWNHTSSLLQDNLTFTQRILRQNGRPQVHLAGNYEQAVAIYQKFRDSMLGIFSDIRCPRNGKLDDRAGIDFVKMVRSEQPYLPVMIQSSEENTRRVAAELDASHLFKNSPTLSADFRRILAEHFNFGDLVFRDDKQVEVARVSNIEAFISVVDSLPPDILSSYYRRGDLRRWLLVRTEFQLAQKISLPSVAMMEDPAELRRAIKDTFLYHYHGMHRGSVIPYSRRFRINQWHFYRMGGGSMGGKARGLAFIDKVLTANLKPGDFPDVNISIPRTLVLGTDLFDEFIRKNDLFGMALAERSDIRIANDFIHAELPPTIVGDLLDFIRQLKAPLAVRSSSLLEDALYQPFAGIYLTKMIPNNQDNLDARFLSLANAIKLVWASTFFQQAKAYIESTGHRVEEEKMAVVVQEVVGQPRGNTFYPDFSGVARSYNYYPVGSATPEDGVVNVALGLGKTVVDGGASLRFTPGYPRILPQFGTTKDMLNNSQREFYAVNLKPPASSAYADEDQYLLKLDLKQAELDGTLGNLASTYSPQDDRFYDGINQPGPRTISFANILKNQVFPLAPVLERLLQLSREAMGCPVEMEFAVNLEARQVLPAEFGFLQVRPLVVGDELVKVDLKDNSHRNALCYSHQVLGNGISRESADLVYVKPETFNAANSLAIAGEIELVNTLLKEQGRTYVLIGPGRWGSTDPWLGIPVKWNQISRAKTIVEVSLPNLNVDPSQGSHFFQNMTSLRIGYFTVPMNPEHGRIDWPRLNSMPAVGESENVRHLRFERPLEVLIDGRTGYGVILPG